MEARRGAIAICSLGTLGIITHDEPQDVEYPDGNKGKAYVGYHLTEKVTQAGEKWSSRDPQVIGYTVLELTDFFGKFRDAITNL